MTIVNLKNTTRFGSIVAIAIMASACGVAPRGTDVQLASGPEVTTARSVSSIVTPYDEALACVGRIVPSDQRFTLAAGDITDGTGKETYSDGGNGKYVLQTAGDIVQAALVDSGAAVVVNRRDPGVMILESKFGRGMAERNDKINWMMSDFHMNGSITRLDFLPGAGVDLNVAGVGPSYRQYRMLVGMKLFTTNSINSQVVANSSINKQIVAEEYGLGIGRFFGTTLVSLDLGGNVREAQHFAMEQMVKLGVYEMLEELYGKKGIDVRSNCRSIIGDIDGVESVDDKVSSVVPSEGTAGRSESRS